MNRSMTFKDGLLLFVIAIFWGTSYLFIKLAVETIPPCTIVEARLFLASISLIIFVYLTGGTLPRPGRAWIPYIMLGITNCVIPYLLIAWGEIYIDSGLAAILQATMPLFTIIIAHFVARTECMTKVKIAGISVGLVGVTLLIGPDAIKGLGINLWAQLAIIGSSLSYASAAVYGSKLEGHSPLVLSAGQMLAAAVFMAPMSLFDYPWAFKPSAVSLIALVFLALFGTALPYVIYFRLIATIGATRSSLVTYLMPGVGLVFGAVFLNEDIHWRAVLALVLILSGVAGVNGGRGRNKTIKETTA